MGPEHFWPPIIILSITIFLVKRTEPIRRLKKIIKEKPSSVLLSILSNKDKWSIKFRECCNSKNLAFSFKTGSLNVRFINIDYCLDLDGKALFDRINTISEDAPEPSFVSAFTDPETFIYQIASITTKTSSMNTVENRVHEPLQSFTLFGSYFKFINYISETQSNIHIYTTPCKCNIELLLPISNRKVYITYVGEDSYHGMKSLQQYLQSNTWTIPPSHEANEIDKFTRKVYRQVEVETSLTNGATISCGKHYVICPPNNISFRAWSKNKGFVDIENIIATVREITPYGIILENEKPTDVFHWERICFIPFKDIDLQNNKCQLLIDSIGDSTILYKGCEVSKLNGTIERFKKDTILFKRASGETFEIEYSQL